MSRDITAGMITEITSDEFHPVFLFKGEFTDGDLRFWTGVGTVSFGGEDYVGAGNLIGMTDIQETDNIEAKGAKFSLNGISSSLISTVLADESQGQPITCWFGVLDSSLSLVSDPFIIFKGFMDVPQIQEGGETATIIVSAENALIELKRPRVRRYTQEDQQTLYMADTGLNFVSDLQDKEIVWGRTV